VNPLEYAKAIVGGILAGLGVLGTALVDDVVTSSEWVGVAVATLTVFSAVFGIPNASKKDVISQQTVTVETTQVDAGPEHRADPIPGL
jgi:hypothetical protein